MHSKSKKCFITSTMPEVIKPEDFQKLPGLHQVYEGNLKVYQGRKDEERSIKRKKRKDNGTV